jgi:hypothetical protein
MTQELKEFGVPCFQNPTLDAPQCGPYTVNTEKLTDIWKSGEKYFKSHPGLDAD